MGRIRYSGEVCLAVVVKFSDHRVTGKEIEVLLWLRDQTVRP